MPNLLRMVQNRGSQGSRAPTGSQIAVEYLKKEVQGWENYPAQSKQQAFWIVLTAVLASLITVGLASLYGDPGKACYLGCPDQKVIADR